MNISSIVIKCAPQFLEEVVASLKDSGECEVYAFDEFGRIIIILEGETTEEETQKLRGIQMIPHILSADMVYAFSETEFSPEAGKFEFVNKDLVDRLNDETDAKEIVYNGHLKD